ncbi:MAG: hypothetical protein RL591_2226 [Planctomycetota bacterium]
MSRGMNEVNPESHRNGGRSNFDSKAPRSRRSRKAFRSNIIRSDGCQSHFVRLSDIGHPLPSQSPLRGLPPARFTSKRAKAKRVASARFVAVAAAAAPSGAIHVKASESKASRERSDQGFELPAAKPLEVRDPETRPARPRIRFAVHRTALNKQAPKQAKAAARTKVSDGSRRSQLRALKEADREGFEPSVQGLPHTTV